MSLEFLTMRGTNFCTLRDLPPFALSNRGMILILGDNQDATKADSNGAGKSLLLELFVWTLWGKTIRGLTGDDVVNDVVLKNCFGEVIFTVGGHTYTARRYRAHSIDKNDRTVNQKKNDLVLLMDGKPYATEGKMAETQESINQLLGITFPIFEAMMPGTGIRAASMGDAGIKELLESILQTEVYSVAEKIAKKRLKAAELALSQEEASLSQYETDVSSLGEDIEWNNSLLRKFDTARQERIDQALEEWAVLSREIEACREEIDTKTTLLDSLYTEDQWQARVALVETLQKELADHKSEVRDMLTKLRDEWNRIQPEQDRLHTDECRLATMGPSCSECLQDIGEEYREQQVAEIAAQRAPLAKQLKENEESQVRIKKVSDDLVKKFEVKVQEASDHADQAREQYKQGMRLGIDIEALKAQEQSKGTQIPRLAEASKEGPGDSSEIEERIEALQLSLDEKKEEKDETLESIAASREKVKALAFWVHGYSTKGIRSHVLKSVTPVLNEITRKNCETLTGAEMSIVFNTQTTLGSGEVREKFDIQVSQAHGGDSYKKNSEGEKQRADVVIAMSLADLAAMRTNFPFRFLDEPFVKVDESGTDAIIQLLRQYEAEYDTIFVVTHQEQVKSMFAAPLTVVKSGGVSRLEGDANGN